MNHHCPWQRLLFLTFGVFPLGGVPREQKMLKGHLPRVIYHQVYQFTKKRISEPTLRKFQLVSWRGHPEFSKKIFLKKKTQKVGKYHTRKLIVRWRILSRHKLVPLLSALTIRDNFRDNVPDKIRLGVRPVFRLNCRTDLLRLIRSSTSGLSWAWNWAPKGPICWASGLPWTGGVGDHNSSSSLLLSSLELSDTNVYEP